MKENLNDLMNWADIEGLQYADIDCPRCTLGPSERKGKKTLIQVFVLDATSVSIRFDKEKKLLPMEKMDENFLHCLYRGQIKDCIM